MLFHDPSCRAELTLKEHMALGVYALCGLDWAAICTLTNRGILYVDGQINVTDVDGGAIRCIVENRARRFTYQEETDAFREGDYYFWYHPIRKDEGYWVFSVYCKKGAPISEGNLAWMRIYCKLKYDYILLNNESVQERDLSESVMDSIESAIIVLDMQQDIISCNDKVQKVFGLRPGNLLGRRLTEEMGKRHRQSLLHALNTVLTQGKRRYLNDFLLIKEDRECVINMSLSPLRNSKGIISGAVVVASDVTERKYMEHELQQTRQFGLLGQIATGLAHDVKNPLMTIDGCARALLRNRDVADEHKEFLNVILHESSRINGVVEQMLSFGKVTRNNPQEPLDMNEVLFNSVQIINRQKSRKFIDVNLHLDERPLMVKADNSSVQQAILNILVNSVEAIEDSGGIDISSRLLSDGQIEIHIKDTGRGIPRHRLDKLFAPYYSTKKQGGNNGLGLYLAKRVMNQYGARIDVFSAENMGTDVQVLFPGAS